MVYAILKHMASAMCPCGYARHVLSMRQALHLQVSLDPQPSANEIDWTRLSQSESLHWMQIAEQDALEAAANSTAKAEVMRILSSNAEAKAAPTQHSAEVHLRCCMPAKRTCC